MSEYPEVKIKGHNGQKVRLVDFTERRDGTNNKNIFVAAGFEDEDGEGLNLGAYVNREKFLKKIAKFFNVVIYDVGYSYDVHNGGYGDTMIVTETRHGYHRYTEED
jgi:hypothetical protein